MQSEIVWGRSVEWMPFKIKMNERFKRDGVLRIGIFDKEHKPKGHCEFSYTDLIDKDMNEFKMLKFDRKKSAHVEKGTIKILRKDLDI
jgi:hypothetical protein